MKALKKKAKKPVQGKEIRLKGQLPLLIIKEDDSFIAYTPALDLSSCGSTFAEAQNNFEEALYLFIEECLKDGTLPDVLASLGWKELPGAWSPPQVVGRIDMPLPDISLRRGSHHSHTIKTV